MGWGQGSELFSGVIEAAIKHLPDAEKRKAFYADVYPVFAENDWDTQDECLEADTVFETFYCELFGTIPVRQQYDLAIEAFQQGSSREDLATLPILVECNEDVIDEIWYYVKELQVDGVAAFCRMYDIELEVTR